MGHPLYKLWVSPGQVLTDHSERRRSPYSTQAGGQNLAGGICGYGWATAVQSRSSTQGFSSAPVPELSIFFFPLQELKRDPRPYKLGPVFQNLHGSPDQQLSREDKTAAGLPDTNYSGSSAMRGEGWLAYDSYFRPQAVGDDLLDWLKLNQSLYAVTFIAQGEREKATCCTLGLESDHPNERCGLYSPPLKSSVSVGKKRAPVEMREQSRSKRPARFAWNQGECRFQSCKYHQVCVKCAGNHRITLCLGLRGERDIRAPREFRNRGQNESD